MYKVYMCVCYQQSCGCSLPCMTFSCVCVLSTVVCEFSAVYKVYMCVCFCLSCGSSVHCPMFTCVCVIKCHVGGYPHV